MTNREKFKEIFGFDLNTDHMDCIVKGSCKDCPLAFIKGKRDYTVFGEEVFDIGYKYDHCPKFWDDEYVEHDCTNCQHGDTDDTELPCRECGVGQENKWSPIDEYIDYSKTAKDEIKKRCRGNGKHVDSIDAMRYCLKDCHKYDMDSKEPPCEDCNLDEKINRLDYASMYQEFDETINTNPDDKCLQYAKADAEMCKQFYDAAMAHKNALNTLEMYNTLKNDKFGVEVPTAIVEHDIRIRDLEDGKDYYADMERCMDNYDSILKLHVRKIENLEKQLLNRFYGTDNTKPFDTTPMCNVHITPSEPHNK